MGGATIGGIGISGGNAPGRDDEIARAGLGVLEAAEPPIPAQLPLPQPEQQQHSRPYMQPSSSYPSMPPTQPAQSVPAYNNPPVPSAAAGNAPSSAPLSNSRISGTEQSNLAGTHYLVPEEQPYNDQTNLPSNDNRSGGQQ